MNRFTRPKADRRSMLGRATTLGLLGAASLGAALAPAKIAASAVEHRRDRGDFQIAGGWDVSLNIQEIARLEHTLWAVFPDGMFIHSSSSGTPGVGQWKRTDRRAFTITFRDFLLSTDNVIESQLRVQTDCTFTAPDTVSITAVATVLGLDGSQIGTFHSSGTGTRFTG